MKTFLLEQSTLVPRSLRETFEFFADAGNLQAITPPWLHFQILTPLPIAMDTGTLIDYRIRLHGIAIRWRTRICAWDPPLRFIDEQLRGPYRVWRHEHRFEEDPGGSGGTLMRDRVTYAPPGWVLAPLIVRMYVGRELERIFAYRRETLLKMLGP